MEQADENQKLPTSTLISLPVDADERLQQFWSRKNDRLLNSKNKQQYSHLESYLLSVILLLASVFVYANRAEIYAGMTLLFESARQVTRILRAFIRGM